MKCIGFFSAPPVHQHASPTSPSTALLLADLLHALVRQPCAGAWPLLTSMLLFSTAITVVFWFSATCFTISMLFLLYFCCFLLWILSPCSVPVSFLGGDFSFWLLFADFVCCGVPFVGDSNLAFCGANSVVLARILEGLLLPESFTLPLVASLYGLVGSFYGPGHLFD